MKEKTLKGKKVIRRLSIMLTLTIVVNLMQMNSVITYAFSTTQTPSGAKSWNDQLNTLVEIVNKQIVPQSVKAILATYNDAFGYLEDCDVGIGLEIINNPDSSSMANVSFGIANRIDENGNKTYDLKYGLTVNRAYLGFKSNGTLSESSTNELEGTIVHEMMKAFMDEAMTNGMLSDSKGYPKWFVEGMAQTMTGGYADYNDWVNGGLRIDTTKTVQQISDSVKTSRNQLSSSSGYACYGSGYLACMYLGQLASDQGLSTDVITPENIRKGLNIILGELVSGQSLDSVIREASKGTYSSNADFESKFGDLDSSTFIFDLTAKVENGNGSLIKNDFKDNDLLPNENAETTVFKLNTNAKYVINRYPDEVEVMSGGGRTEDGKRPIEDYPFCTTITDTISVTEIDAPTTGNTLDPEGTCATTGISTTTPTVTWKIGETEATETAVGATEYTAYVTLDASTGYKFGATPTVTIDGRIATVISRSGSQVTVKYTFSETDAIEVSSVAVTEIDAPITGNTLDPEGTCATTGISTTTPTVTWKIGETEATGTAVGATEYTAYVTLDASTGYKFAATPIVTVGGRAATVTSRSALQITVKYTFVETSSGSPDGPQPTTICVIHFDSHGGSPVGDMEVEKGKTANLPKPTRSSYKFAGWFIGIDGSGEKYTNATAITTSATLHANWIANSHTSSGNTSSLPETKTETPNVETPKAQLVTVNGKNYDIGLQKVSGNETIVTIDHEKLADLIEKFARSTEIVIPIQTNTDKVRVEIGLQNIKAMEDKSISLKIENDKVAYTIPAKAVDIAQIIEELDGVDQKDIQFEVILEKADREIIKQIENMMKDQGKLVGLPMIFETKVSAHGKQVGIHKFGKYVTRRFEITKEQAGEILTCAVIDHDGNLHHVPTNILTENGKYYADVSSITNSTYALVKTHVSYSDATGKWYEGVANELGSRVITKCLDKANTNTIQGGKEITREEFAALIVNALGLPRTSNAAATFSDVTGSSYTAEIGAAYEYGIINGVTEKTFEPSKTITRQEAMAMLQRAAKIAELAGQEGDTTSFKDASKISNWAQEAVAFNVGNGLIVGSNGEVRPQATITRAESMTATLRLLQKSNLIDVRTEA